MKKKPTLHATTVLAVRHNDQVVIGADGQATMGDCVVKQKVIKLRDFSDGKVVVGFAGATADAFTLLERLEEKLATYNGALTRAALELAKDWRMDRYLRRLEAMIIAASQQELLLLSGVGDVIEPEENVVAIGSGGMYALAAARALQRQRSLKLTAEEIVRQSLGVAADICVYTNHNINVKCVKN